MHLIMYLKLSIFSLIYSLGTNRNVKNVLINIF